MMNNSENSYTERKNALEYCPLFQTLNGAELEALEKKGQLRNYNKADLIFSENSQADGIYIILSGEVCLFLTGNISKRELILKTQGQNELLTGSAEIEQRHHTNARATLLTRLLFISWPVLQEFAEDHSSIYTKLIDLYAEELQFLTQRLKQLSFMSVSERLADYLLNSITQIPHKLEPNTQIAAYLGTIPEVVSRHLATLSKKGIIQLRKRTIEQINPSALAEQALSAKYQPSKLSTIYDKD